MRAKEFIVEADEKREPSARERFLNSVIGPESGGKSYIKNPYSSATGLFQFIKSTWDNTVKKAKPGDAHYGVSFKDMQTNPKAQRAAADQISREYQASIQRNKLPDTPGMYYLLHGHGPKALELYNSPNKQLKDIYDPYVYNKKGEIVYDQKTGKPKKSLVYAQNPNFNPEEKVSTFIANRAASMGDSMSNMYPDDPKLASVKPTIKTKKGAPTPTDTTQVATKTTDTTPPPVVTKTTQEPSVVSQYVDANIDKVKKAVADLTGSTVAPKTATATSDVPKDNKKVTPKIDSPEYEKMMWDKQVAAGDKFSKEREARLEKERIARSKGLPIEPPITEPDLDPKGWAAYDAYMNKLQTEKGDKSAREREARLEKERAAKPTDSSQPSQDDSYYTKFMNLFK